MRKGFGKRMALTGTALLLSLSAVPVYAADQYILLLPASSEIVYDLDSDFVAEKYSTEEYTILLYEAGETVEIGITTDLAYVLEDASDGSVYDEGLTDEDGVLSFAMPEKDLCLIPGEKEGETGETEENAYSAEKTETASGQITETSGGVRILLEDGLSASVTMTDGTVTAVPEGENFWTDEGIDFFEIYSPEGFPVNPTAAVYKNGSVADDLSDVIVGEGGKEENYTFDIADSLDPEDTYIIKVTKSFQEEEEADETEQEDQAGRKEAGEEKEMTEQSDEGKTGSSVSLKGGLSAELLLVDGTAVSVDTDGYYTGDMEIDLIDVFFKDGVHTESPVICLYKDGEQVTDVSEYILNEDGAEGSYRFDINNILHYEGTYEFVIADADASDDADTETEAEVSDTAGSSGVSFSFDDTVKNGEDFTFRVEIEEGYAITETFAVLANGTPLKVNPDGSFTVKTVTEDQDITVEGIVKADEDAPVLSTQAETYEGRGDGKIVGLETDMEYSTDGVSYTEVADPAMEFAPGVYYVRYADEDENGTWEAVPVRIDGGKKISVMFTADDEVVDVIEVGYGEGIPEADLPEIPEKDGYDKTKAYWDAESLDNITEDLTVSAVYPEKELTISFSTSAGRDDSSEENPD